MGPRVGAARAPALTPLTVKLLAADHALCTKFPLTDCTRQKYVPLPSPLTVSCVAPMVELFVVMMEKVDDVLTCQLYAMIPLGSVTADQEMVSGALKVAPEAGESRLGAGGVAAFAMCGMNRKKQKMTIKPKVGERCFFIGLSPCFVQATDHRHGINMISRARVIAGEFSSG